MHCNQMQKAQKQESAQICVAVPAYSFVCFVMFCFNLYGFLCVCLFVFWALFLIKIYFIIKRLKYEKF